MRSIALKEYKHILRDPFTLAVTLILPLVFVGLFGFVIDLDYKQIKVAVVDNDQTSASRRFLAAISASGYLKLMPLQSNKQAAFALYGKDSPSVMTIEKDFGRNIMKGNPSQPAQAQLMLDGGDNAKAGVILSYIASAISKANGIFIKNNPELETSQTNISSAGGFIRSRFLFNPELNSRWFIVPALNTIIIGFLAIVLTALTIAREWENGSMELLLSTPLRPYEIIFGKLLPYFSLTFFDILVVFILSMLVFRIPFLGSFPLFIISCCIYIAGALALGLLISTATRNQQAAIQFALAVGLLPSFIFSGFIFPIENMPLFFRWFTAIFPQRWFLAISRLLFLSEADFHAVAAGMIALAIFTLTMVFLAIKNSKTDVEI
jgi:ABC-2 type transport system permease protein